MPNRHLYILLSLLMCLSLWAGGSSIAPAFAQDAPRPPQIIVFDSDITALRLAEVEAGETPITLEWQVANFDADLHQLRLESYMLGQWVPTGDEDETLGVVDGRVLTVRHTLDFHPPAYRLSILRLDDNAVLDSRTLALRYSPSENAPSISAFGTLSVEVLRDELQAESARVALSWQVQNRPQTANLEFVQVAGDQLLNVELPRSAWWVPSQGEGFVAPVAFPGAEQLTLRLQMVDVISGELYDSAEVTLPIVDPVLEALPTEEAAPSDNSSTPNTGGQSSTEGETVTASNGALSLSINPAPIQRSTPLNLIWTAPNAENVTIFLLYYDNTVDQWVTVPGNSNRLADLAPSGSASFSLPESYRQDEARFRLQATYPDGTTASTDTDDIRLDCRPLFFNSNGCSTFSPQNSSGIYQSYENGLIIWRAQGDFLVLVNDAGWFIAEDTYTQGEVVSFEAEVPEGALVPTGRFAKLWQNNEQVQALGLPTANTTNFTLQQQRALNTTNPALDALYVSTPGGQVLRLLTAGQNFGGPAWEESTFTVR